MNILTESIQLILNHNSDLVAIVLLSLRISLTATLIASAFAIPLGAILASYQFIGQRFIRVIASSFMALPPVVVGLVVYLCLSRSGPLGEYGLLFTPKAMIIAQTILIFPIVLVLSSDAIQPLERDYKLLMHALDVPPLLKLRTLIWDARFALSSAILAGFGRALAEVGAVIIVGGNINGLTRVMTTTIALETSKGNLQLALSLGLILITIAVFVNSIIQGITFFGRKYQEQR